jgi:hypothetical protein
LPTAAPAGEGKLNVLILGDSLALCGFGKRLDTRFREAPHVNATFTYMACGTNPISWMKRPPYTNVRTQCGYWSIESTGNGQEPRELRDSYGMGQKGPLKAHFVPKLEEMVPTLQPDILIIQTGSNLFGLFPDAKTVKSAKHAADLKKYLLPFKELVMSPPSKLRKVYWVSPTISGRVGKEVQDFVLEQVRKELGPEVTVIDSRPMIPYPFQQMEPDKEHFTGPQMDEWADKVFAAIDKDLNAQPIASLKPLSEAAGVPRAEQVIHRAEPVARRAEAVAQRAEPVPTAAAPDDAPKKQEEPLVVKAKLVYKSAPMQLEELLPYQESLVAYVYDVEKVVRGEYSDQQVLVMHPSFIELKPQKLDKIRLGKSYKLRLHPLDGTLWSTAKMRDDSGKADLTPLMRVEDIKRHPNRR